MNDILEYVVEHDGLEARFEFYADAKTFIIHRLEKDIFREYQIGNFVYIETYDATEIIS